MSGQTITKALDESGINNASRKAQKLKLNKNLKYYCTTCINNIAM